MIYLASDHAGFELKEKIKVYLVSAGYEIEDCGAHILDTSDDYPTIIYPAAEKVAAFPGSKGIIFGKSGEGEAMVANKVAGIRAAVYYGGNSEIAKLSREHNDANILSIGAGFVSEQEATKIVTEWLNQTFAGGRHERRVEEVETLEKEGLVQILPAILSKNVEDYIRKVKAAEKITREVQIDIIDNKFARNLTIGVKEISSIQTKLQFEIHLMVEFIEDWVDPFVKINPKRIVIPFEAARDPIGTIFHLRNHNIEVGFSLNPETKAESLQHIIDKIDTALVLSVHPGFSGQHFVHGALGKIKKLREMRPDLVIEIDGAVAPGVARKAVEAGVNILVSASFLFDNDELPGASYNEKVANAFSLLQQDITST